MDKILLTDLIAKTRKAIAPLGHSQSTLYQYGLAWNELIAYFTMNGQTLFSEDLAHQFVNQACEHLRAGKLKPWKFKLHRLATSILIEVYQTGGYKWQHHCADPNEHLSADYKKIHEAFQNYLAKKGKSNGTCELYGTVSRQFLTYVQNELKMAVSNLQLFNINAAIVSMSRSYQKTSMRTVLSALRIFISFLWLTGETRINLMAAVPSSGVRKVTVVPTLTPEEEVQLLSANNRSTPLGKRNYAMILLAIRTGLRSVDITNLKLADVDWRTNTISIIQQKNRRPLSLPLLPEVGNALIDYILQARPKSDEPYLFLKIFPPFSKLTSCYNISRRLVDKFFIGQGRNQYKGFHIFRHSVASRMLKSEVSLSVISNALGHGSPESSKVYLSTDGAHLKACALTLKGIEVSKEELI